MAWLRKNRLFILGFAIGAFYYFDTMAPPARHCIAAGGSYWLNGDCGKFVYFPVTPKDH